MVVPDSDLVVVVGSDISSPEMSPIIEHWICESVVPAAFPSKESEIDQGTAEEEADGVAVPPVDDLRHTD